MKQSEIGIIFNFTDYAEILLNEQNAFFIKKSFIELFETIPVGIFVLNDFHKLIYSNRLADEFYEQVISPVFDIPMEMGGEVIYTSFLHGVNRTYAARGKIYTLAEETYKCKDKSISCYHIISVTVKVLTSLTVDSNRYCLTARQLEIASMVAEGCSNKEIAECLFLSVHTVNKHLDNIFKKLGVNNRIEAINKLFENKRNGI